MPQEPRLRNRRRSGQRPEFDARLPAGAPPPLPTPPAGVVPPERPGSAVAPNQRPVSHPGVGSDAAADPGRSGAAEVRRVADQVPDTRGTRRGRRNRRVGNLAAARLQRPPASPARHCPRVGRDDTAARCRRTKRRCSRSRASARTPPARCAASLSASARPSSTPTSHACCSECSSAAARRRRTRCAGTSGASRAPCCPMRHVFDFNQALMDFGATLCTARKPNACSARCATAASAYPFNPENERTGRVTDDPACPASSSPPRSSNATEPSW